MTYRFFQPGLSKARGRGLLRRYLTGWSTQITVSETLSTFRLTLEQQLRARPKRHNARYSRDEVQKRLHLIRGGGR